MYILHTLPTHCPYCVQAKDLLKIKAKDFQERVAGQDFSKEQLEQLLGPVRTLPQILQVNAHGDLIHIGGFQDLRKQLAGGGATVRRIKSAGEFDLENLYA